MTALGADGIVLGIDLATAGVRVHAVQIADGTELARVSADLPAPRTVSGVLEQDPRYAEVALRLLAEVAQVLGGRTAEVRGIAVTGTSGTVVPVDRVGVAVGPAVMYNDASTSSGERALADAGVARPAAMLARIAGVLDRSVEAARVASPADVVTAALIGGSVPMDTSHALKAAVDPAARTWDAEALLVAGVDRGRLPALVAPGSALGAVAAGPFRGAVVVAGMTDGCTSQIATGAVGVGDTVGILGTTLVLKAGAGADVVDIGRGVYSHLSPDEVWLPGGASNVGAGSLAALVPDAAGPRVWQRLAASTSPSRIAVYPLPRVGERFPVADAELTLTAVGGDWPPGRADAVRAIIEGVALVERWSLDVLADLGVASDRHVLSGGASASTLWSTVRASALGRTVRVAESRDSGFGAAVLAASAVTGQTLALTAHRMAQAGTEIEPDAALTAHLDERYAALRAAID